MPLFRESVTPEKAGLVSSPDLIWHVYHFQYKAIRAGVGFESGTVTKTGQAKVGHLSLRSLATTSHFYHRVGLQPKGT